MILFEFEGKKILSDAGIKVPVSQLITQNTSSISIKTPLVLKAQVLSGKRADAGGIVMVDANSKLGSELSNLFKKEINGELVQSILAEEKIEIKKEFYFSLFYDTDCRAPVLSVSGMGGTGIEEREVKVYQVDPLDPIKNFKQIQDETGISYELLNKLVNLFFDSDMLLLEINPLVKTSGGDFLALDAKIKLDDTASGRHKEDWNFPPRSAPGHTPTKAEIEAKKIDEGDYRGTAGSTYFDLDGDIAILASGGGASITAMDALIKTGGKPANYTEYSGNPPKEKVEKLTKIVLSKPGLHGLWIVGALANFTDIYETLSGFIEGLRFTEKELGKKIDFPIVIRRAGPNDKKAFGMLKKEAGDFDLHLFGEETSIPQSAKIIAALAKKYINKANLSS